MTKTMRTLTLSAAALAALVSLAPQASAQERGRSRGYQPPRQEGRAQQPRQEGRAQQPRQEGRAYGYGRGNGGYDRGHGYGYRGYGNQGYGNHGYGNHGYGYGYGYRYVAPRPAFRYGYASPFRVFSGFRFYSYCPGPGYVYVADYGWVLPPFAGAVWIPGYYDDGGAWIEGFWR